MLWALTVYMLVCAEVHGRGGGGRGAAGMVVQEHRVSVSGEGWIGGKSLRVGWGTRGCRYLSPSLKVWQESNS